MVCRVDPLLLKPCPRDSVARYPSLETSNIAR